MSEANRCDFRTHCECTCRQGECQQLAPQHLGDFVKWKPPVIVPSWLDGLAFGLLLTGLMMFGFVMAEMHLQQRDLAEQEARAIVRVQR